MHHEMQMWRFPGLVIQEIFSEFGNSVFEYVARLLETPCFGIALRVLEVAAFSITAFKILFLVFWVLETPTFSFLCFGHSAPGCSGFYRLRTLVPIVLTLSSFGIPGLEIPFFGILGYWQLLRQILIINIISLFM